MAAGKPFRREVAMERQTVGELMASVQREGWAKIGWIAISVVYFACIGISGIFSWTLFERLLPPGFKAFAPLILLVNELSAIALPILAKYGTAPGAQRIWVRFVYFVDLAVIALNSFLFVYTQLGYELPRWLELYALFSYGFIAFMMLAYSVTVSLDPANRLQDVVHQARAAAVEALAQRLVAAASAVDVDRVIDLAAQELARRVAESVVGGIRLEASNGALVANGVEASTAVPKRKRGRENGGEEG
jgi:hypothetical protein